MLTQLQQPLINLMLHEAKLVQTYYILVKLTLIFQLNSCKGLNF